MATSRRKDPGGTNGHDLLTIGSNYDYLHGHDGPDILNGDERANTLEGGNGHDELDGKGGADTLFGSTGRDTLDGGAGKDTLYGNEDADTFKFVKAGDSTVGARDVVKDFESGDKLDLKELGTDLEVRYQKFDETGTENDKTIIQVDVNKDGDVQAGEDFELELKGLHDLSETNDFLLTGDNASVVEVTDIVVA